MERWIAVPDYEGRYYVSDMGEIISVRNNDAFIMKQFDTHNGYKFVCLSLRSKVKTTMVHRIVYQSFKGKTNLTIDHIKEGNKHDNRLCNLQALSVRENAVKYRKSVKSSSSYLGVSKWQNRWKSQITVGKNRIYLGLYKTEIDAHNAYISYLQKLQNQ